MAKGRLIKGGGFMENLAEYEPTLYILYGIGVIILIVLIYIVFFRTSITTILSPSPVGTGSPTTAPTKSISSQVGNKVKDLKQKVNNTLDDVQILTVIKGKLEDWGDDIDKLPSDVKEKAITCYKNKDGCIF